MSTLIKPHIPRGSEPSRDDDPTGVRALLASLPHPDPMPEHLVERINASLAAEQARRAATMSGTSPTPLLARARRRPGRMVFAIAGVAAAMTLMVVGSNVLTMNQQATISGSASLQSTSSDRVAGAADGKGAEREAAEAPPPAGSTAAEVQIRVSGTLYTQAGFVTQARNLRGTAPHPDAGSASLGPAGTAPGLLDCLRAIGATGAQLVRADVAFYEGRPAVVIVATTNGITVAYVVGRQCSHADAALLRGATPLA